MDEDDNEDYSQSQYIILYANELIDIMDCCCSD